MISSPHPCAKQEILNCSVLRLQQFESLSLLFNSEQRLWRRVGRHTVYCFTHFQFRLRGFTHRSRSFAGSSLSRLKEILSTAAYYMSNMM